jgi:hypothetical protein
VIHATSGALVRLDQRWAGMPVRGGGALALVRGADVEILHTSLVRSLAPSGPALPPGAIGARCARLLEAPLGSLALTRLVLPSGGQGRLAWSCRTEVTVAGGEELVLDAASGAPLLRQPLGRPVLGRVFEEDPVSSVSTVDRELSGLPPGATSLRAADGLLSVLQYAGGDAKALLCEESAGPSDGMDFLYNPPEDPKDPEDAFAAVQAYHHGRRAQGFFQGRLGVEMAGEEWRLGVVVNAGRGGARMDNAYYSPLGLPQEGLAGLIALGQGNYADFALDSDVLLHEYTHHVAHRAIGFSEGQFAVDEGGFAPMAGAIEEGLADYVAASLNGDAALGESLPEPLRRDLRGVGRRCPEDVTGEVHEDGAIVGAAAWEIREVLGAERADALLWEAAARLTRGADFGEFSISVLGAAEQRMQQGELDSQELLRVRDVLQTRGLLGCRRELALDEVQRTGLWGLEEAGRALGKSCEQLREVMALQSTFRYVYQPPPGATRARIRVTLQPLDEGSLRWSLLIKRGAPLGFHPGPSGFPEPDAADMELRGVEGQEGELEVELQGGQPLHAVIVHQNCASSRIFLEASVTEAEAPGGRTWAPALRLEGVRFEQGHVGCNFQSTETPYHGWGSGWILGLGLAGARRWRRK